MRPNDFSTRPDRPILASAHSRLRAPTSPHRLTIFLLSLFLAAIGCGRAEPDFANPAATFNTYREAIQERDFERLWTCFSQSYHANLPQGRQTWLQEWEQKTDAQLRSETRREIAEERIINERIAYLLFDGTTLDSRQVSPFFYFVREADGWKITSHLDSLFHRELEGAIERGEFELPTH